MFGNLNDKVEIILFIVLMHTTIFAMEWIIIFYVTKAIKSAIESKSANQTMVTSEISIFLPKNGDGCL